MLHILKVFTISICRGTYIYIYFVFFLDSSNNSGPPTPPDLSTSSVPLTPTPSPASPQFPPMIDVDQQTDSNSDTALTLAAAGGHDELVTLLLVKGSDIEHRDKKGRVVDSFLNRMIFYFIPLLQVVKGLRPSSKSPVK